MSVFCCVLAGCTAGSDEKHHSSASHFVSARHLCGSDGLSPEAAKAVEYLANSTKFDKDLGGLSPQAAADALAGDYLPGHPTDPLKDVKQLRACDINLHDGEWGAITAELSIVSDSEIHDESSDINGGTYRLGKNAAYSYPGGADLYFKCVSDQLAGSSLDHPLVRAELKVAPSLWHLPGHKEADVQKAQLVLINGIALTASKHLGCTDDGGLRSMAKPQLVAEHHGSSSSASAAATRRE
ncbi:hypothetical protein [Streptomyces sp. NRRL F-5126]|uniref:hypothetical protein n=1 Tax=Streptomyces sp. NRRL F-5126 TaxID=1463857 RepID=UPI00131D86E2|nr:hypothetical protein [Streptomyces sp. NRRL F-5126]